MAFLFRGKKDADKTQDIKDNPSVARPPTSLQSSNGRTNEKQTITGSSVDNPNNLLHGRGTQTTSPSPEQLKSLGRREPRTFQQAQDHLVSYNSFK
jgi:hypothetical protein